MAAMFWLKWLVTAESSSDPHAAINSQSVLSPGLGTASASKDGAIAVAPWDGADAAPLTGADGYWSAAPPSGALRLLAIMSPQIATNRRNPTDHASVWVRSLKFG